MLRCVRRLNLLFLISEDESYVKRIEMKSFAIEGNAIFAIPLFKAALIEEIAVDFKNKGKSGNVVGELEYGAWVEKRKERLVVVEGHFGERPISERSFLIESAGGDALVC